MFKISDKVVCVDDSEPQCVGWHPFSEPLKRGRVYVIRGVYCLLGIPGCHVIGIKGGYSQHLACEYGFRQSRFRKLEGIKEESRKKQEEPQPV